MTQLAFDGSNPLDDIRLAYSSILNWYALRIFYNRIEPLRQTLDVAAIRYFYPHHLVEKCSDCESLDMIRLKHVGSVSLYFDHRTRKPLIIPDEQMEPFIKLCDIKDSGLEYLGEDGPQFHKGDRVRVIDGIFKGYEGHIKRIKHDRRLIVTIEGVAAFATKFIPPAFLEKVETDK